MVHGRVQGVFFRAEIRRRAELAGVAGSVRNTHDGTVEAVFEGDPDSVGRLVEFCHIGPAGASVERVEIVDEAAEGLVGFRVR